MNKITVILPVVINLEDYIDSMSLEVKKAYEDIVIQEKNDIESIEILRNFAKYIADDIVMSGSPKWVIQDSDIKSLIE
jgi:hypothetical protein